MIPDIKKKEWTELLDGSFNPSLTTFSLQMKLNELKLLVYFKNISLDEAISELHKFIGSNERMFQNDIYAIFSGRKN
jgi:hypothetical protein